MLYNTKLDPYQKNDLKLMRKRQTGVKIVSGRDRTVIAYKNTGNLVEFSTAVASLQEVKYRAKVGEFYARLRMDCYDTVKLPKGVFQEKFLS